MFRNGTKVEQFNVRFDLNYGGLGDIIARLPAIRYAYQQWPHLNMFVFTYDYAYKLVEAALRPFNDRVYVMPFSAQKAWLERRWCRVMPSLDFLPDKITGIRMHLTEQGFAILCDKIPPNKEAWDYLRIDLTNVKNPVYNKTQEDYGVLCTSYTARVRAWPTDHVEEVARWMTKNKITPVLLGKKDNNLGADKGFITSHHAEGNFPSATLDLRDKTDLFEAAKVMSQARFVAGVDNGLLHLASMTEVPTVWGFTTVEPSQRLPFRHGSQQHKTLVVRPNQSLECRFCQSKQHFVMVEGTPWDYKHCMYEDNLCTTQMTAGKFIDKIKQILNYKGYGVTTRRQNERL